MNSDVRSRTVIEKLPDFGEITKDRNAGIEQSPANIGQSHSVSRSVTNRHKMKLAERGGFEPPVPVYTSTAV